MILRMLPALCFAALAGAEIIDRIAVKIDSQVITESQIVEALRVTALLNGEKPDLGPESRRRAAERLVEQTLFQREMELTHYPGPEAAEIGKTLQELKSRYGGEAAFTRELAAHGIAEDEVRKALTRQAAVLRFIELRFRPEVQVQEAEVRQYYEQVYLPAHRNQSPPPSFEEARSDCEDTLIEQLVDKRLDSWIREMKGRMRITYEEGAFQ